MTPADSEQRREIARSMRASGSTWREIGEVLGVSWQRASQLGRPARSSKATWRGTIAEYLEHQRRERAEFAAAHGVANV